MHMKASLIAKGFTFFLIFLPSLAVGTILRRTSSSTAIRQPFAPINFNDTVTGFSWKLFQGSKLADPSGNLVLSPISIQFLLAILDAAAEGETKKQIRDVIGFSSLRTTAQDIKNVLKSKSKTSELSSVTGIFVDSSVNQLNQSFANVVHSVGAEIVSLDFQYSDAVKSIINKWASDATHGHINDLLGPSYRIENTEIILTSAIYFHSAWKYRFNRIGTKLFNILPEKSIQAEFMETKQNFILKTIDLGNNIIGSMIEVPYEGDDYSMVIFLPDDNIPLDLFIRQLDVTTFDRYLKMISNSIPKLMTLIMPKFNVASHFSVVNTLLKMGLVDLFTINSRLPYIGLKDEQKISDIIQQAVLNVDENGTIAAAASAAVLIPLSASRDEIIVTLDRPFLAVILDKKNHVPIFISKIFEPKKSCNPAIGQITC